MTDATIIAAVTATDVQEQSSRAVEIPASIRKLADARFKQVEEENRSSAIRSIRYHVESATEATDRLTKVKETTSVEVQEWAEVQAKLKDAGFKFETEKWNLHLKVTTTERKLVELARAIGPLDPNTVEKELFDAEKKLVKVLIRGLKYPKVKVIYIHKLRETDRCKIVTELVPAKVEHKLVCDV